MFLRVIWGKMRVGEFLYFCMDQIFQNKIWKKNWSGNWGLLFGSGYGDIYTKGVQELVGASFAHNLIVFESGTSSNYLPQDELENYCARVISLIKRDESLPHNWCKQIITNADRIFLLMKKLVRKKSFTEQDFVELQEAKSAVTVRVFSIKKVIDFLPPPIGL